MTRSLARTKAQTTVLSVASFLLGPILNPPQSRKQTHYTLHPLVPTCDLLQNADELHGHP